MKKFSILFNLIFCVPLFFLFALFVDNAKELSFVVENYELYTEHEIFSKFATEYSLWMCFSLIAFLANLAVIILYNVRSFREKIVAKFKARKAERTASKQAKAEANKQKEIAELEKKLDELKKDAK
ncbi:MAG: hypothetical protein K2N22_04385 [Clostridia bacterium]|nr:hypothetical protein [Clostridia bacterium]